MDETESCIKKIYIITLNYQNIKFNVQIRTLILTVDLECCRCSKKIKKAICKLQERIQNIEYDEKKNTVTISGPFDPVKLKNKLCCKACKVIQNINIIVLPLSKPPSKPPPKPPPSPPPSPPPKPSRKPEPVTCHSGRLGYPYRFRYAVVDHAMWGVMTSVGAAPAGVEGRGLTHYQLSIICNYNVHLNIQNPIQAKSNRFNPNYRGLTRLQGRSDYNGYQLQGQAEFRRLSKCRTEFRRHFERNPASLGRRVEFRRRAKFRRCSRVGQSSSVPRAPGGAPVVIRRNSGEVSAVVEEELFPPTLFFFFFSFSSSWLGSPLKRNEGLFIVFLEWHNP
ncbi:hypothetical protein IEQ34_003633 [Dendrobium chrysotoxum]|uniref:HMA domain-containing protein n=1 Tax=Dendrobium chrysotoxum TaxID=161865 RepID=A0AAV7H3B3_DENCH|nr:hypothetical protein IEQ34_003633 [Dendrobium chrysotoxum]